MRGHPRGYIRQSMGDWERNIRTSISIYCMSCTFKIAILEYLVNCIGCITFIVPVYHLYIYKYISIYEYLGMQAQNIFPGRTA